MNDAKFRIILGIIFSYFASYSTSFGSIIDKDIFTKEFFIFFIIDLAIIFLLFNFKKVKNRIKYNQGILIFALSFFIILIILQIYTDMKGKELDSTIIQISENQTLTKTNVYLVNLNITILVSLIILYSLFVYFVIKRQENFKLISCFIYPLIIILIIFCNYLLFTIINGIYFVFSLSGGL